MTPSILQAFGHTAKVRPFEWLGHCISDILFSRSIGQAQAALVPEGDARHKCHLVPPAQAKHMNVAALVEKMKANLHTILQCHCISWSLHLASSSSSSDVLLPKYAEISGNLKET